MTEFVSVHCYLLDCFVCDPASAVHLMQQMGNSWRQL